MTAALVADFKHLSVKDVLTVGGKGGSLGELTQAGIAVPPGFVVTTAAFEQFIAELDPAGSIRGSIAALDPADLATISKLSAQIRARIESGSAGPQICEAIVGAYRELAGDDPLAPVAVRSSATSEDSAEASFAGLQDTYLWVRSSDCVVQAVRSCWASLYSTESVSYRLRLKLPENHVAMGVVVQRMVNSACSGVMFTRSPTTGDRFVITIEASWGLGSCIVSGEVTPDKFVINKVTGEIFVRTISQKQHQHVPNLAAGGVQEELVPVHRQSVACLRDEQLTALAQLGKRIERHYGAAQDIEWAIAADSAGSDGIYLLQSRPETVWAGRESKPVAAPKAKSFDHVLAILSGRDR